MTEACLTAATHYAAVGQASDWSVVYVYDTQHRIIARMQDADPRAGIGPATTIG